MTLDPRTPRPTSARPTQLTEPHTRSFGGEEILFIWLLINLIWSDIKVSVMDYVSS